MVMKVLESRSHCQEIGLVIGVEELTKKIGWYIRLWVKQFA